MKRIVLTIGIASMLLHSSQIEARFGRAELQRVALAAEAILDATIVSSEVVEWTPTSDWAHKLGDNPRCGFKSTIRVNAALSGSHVGQVAIGSAEELVPGRRYLLFVREHGGNFATDVIYDREGEERNRFEECLSRLALWKSNWLTTSDLNSGAEAEVTLSYWLLPPQDPPPGQSPTDRRKKGPNVIFFGSPLRDQLHERKQACRLDVVLHRKNIILGMDHKFMRWIDIGASLMEAALYSGCGTAFDLDCVERARVAGKLQHQVNFSAT